MKKKILNNKTEITEINNENNNPVAIINENFVASTTNDLNVYTSQQTNNWYSSPVQKNSNTQNDSKTIVKQSTTNTESTASENTKSSDISWLAAFLLCLYFGSIGIHRFYLGYTWQGIVQLLTLGGLGIWTLIDFIRIITKDLQPKSGHYTD
ncbi:MAG: TM2 domain-containing protein [Bacteroidales bacterium]